MTEETTAIATTDNSERAFELLQREARALAASSLLPDHFRDNLPNIMIAIDAAKRLNAAPLAVMQAIYIVHGKPAFSSSFLIATVNASGKFTPIRFAYSGEIGSPARGCRAVAADKESGEVCEGPTITLEMARAEGWIDRKGSKWKTMPELMLAYRAAAFWVRLYSPETTMGVYTQEEIHDIGHALVTDADADPSGEKKSKLAQLTARLTPTVDDDDPDVPIPYTTTAPDADGDPEGPDGVDAPEAAPEAAPEEDAFDPISECYALADVLWSDKAGSSLAREAEKIGVKDLSKMGQRQAARLLDALTTLSEREGE